MKSSRLPAFSSLHLSRLSPLLMWLVPVLCAWVALTRGQDTNWDLQNYHLYAPYAFLNDRLLLDQAAAGVQTYFNPLLDLYWYLLPQYISPAKAGTILGFLHGLNFVLVLQILRYCVSHQTGIYRVVPWLLAAAGLLAVNFLSELGTTMNDALVTLPMLGSIVLILRERGGNERWWVFLLAGMLAGAACGLKLVVAVYALALGLALLFSARSAKSGLQQFVLFSVGVACGLLVSSGWWYYKIWVLFGNPIFPQFNDLFGGELAALERIRDERFLPVGIFEYFSFPFILSTNPSHVSELNFRQYAWATAYVLLMLSLVGLAISKQCRERVINAFSREARLLALFIVLGFIFWMHLFGIYRYLIMLDLLLPAFIFLMCSGLLPGKAGKTLGVFIPLLLIGTSYQGVAQWGHAGWAKTTYSIEAPADFESVEAVVLMGQPLAWLIPALDRRIPFLQLTPNFGIKRSGYDTALVAKLEGKSRIRLIYDPGVVQQQAIVERLQQGGYVFQAALCEPLKAYLGQQLYQYQYCRIDKP